jgi:dephospho-CoA kinase
MKIAICGYAGSGKTTFTNMLNIKDYYFFHVDEYVNKLYEENNSVTRFIKKRFSVYADGKIDKVLLGNILLNDTISRILIENLIYKEIKPIIDKEENIIVDGILPRFANKGFDLVLFAYVNKNERRKRLTDRGVTPNRINQIMDVQEHWIQYLE